VSFTRSEYHHPFYCEGGVEVGTAKIYEERTSEECEEYGFT